MYYEENKYRYNIQNWVEGDVKEGSLSEEGVFGICFFFLKWYWVWAGLGSEEQEGLNWKSTVDRRRSKHSGPGLRRRKFPMCRREWTVRWGQVLEAGGSQIMPWEEVLGKKLVGGSLQFQAEDNIIWFTCGEVSASFRWRMSHKGINVEGDLFRGFCSSAAKIRQTKLGILQRKLLYWIR